MPKLNPIQAEKEKIKQVLSNALSSTTACGSFFLQHRITRPYSAIHYEIEKILVDDRIKQGAIIAPRGTGKTTNCLITEPLRRILLADKKFIMNVSATSTLAQAHSEGLKREVLSNEIVRQYWPNLKSSNFTKDCWVTSLGTMVMPRGAGQQVRGSLTAEGARPDLIICDDLETSEGVRSDEQRLKLKDWFFSDLYYSVDRSSDNWKILVIGTLLHDDSLLQNLVNDPEWTTITLSICDEDLKSNWKEFLSDEKVKEIHAYFKSQGNLDIFYREYMGLPMSTEDAVFMEDMFKYYDYEMIKNEQFIVY
jgi:hypothetical protein